MSNLVTAYVALGANLGDRAGALAAAVAALGAPLGGLTASPVFETDAVAEEPQPPYLNMVVRGEARLTARGLLDACLAVEASLGRVRPPGVAKAPRTIDIDLLLYGPAVIHEPGLVVPHPALLARPFVRVPLAAVARPGLRHPITGEALDRAEADASVRLAGGLDHLTTRR